VVASNTTVSDPESARKLGYASLGLSVAGIVVGVILIIVIIVLATEKANEIASSVTSCSYDHHGTCYEYKKPLSYGDYCSGVKSGNYCYYNNY